MNDESKPMPPDEQQPGPDASAPEADGASRPVAEAVDTASEASSPVEDPATMAESLLAQVNEAVSDADAGSAPSSSGEPIPPAATPGDPPEGSTPMNLPSFDGDMPGAIPAELDLLADVNLNVKIELGRTRLLVDDVLKLNEGAVVELDKLAGDPVDIYVNDRHIARGEVLVLNDNFCVRINEIVEPENRQVG